MRISDWSSDVCSSDLASPARIALAAARRASAFTAVGVRASTAAAFRAAFPMRWIRASASSSATAFTASPYGRDRSEEHTSELQSLMRISYAVFCLKKKKKTNKYNNNNLNVIQQK